MADFRQKRERLRKLLTQHSDDIPQFVGSHDAITARLIQGAGFDGIWASSLEISAACGLPDTELITMSEALTRSIYINNSVDLPVVADVDTGFGAMRNLLRTMREYEQAGIAGACFEDKVFPKCNSFLEGQHELLALEDMADRIRATCQERRDPTFVVLARTEALIAGGTISEALDRAQAYAAAGADGVVVHSKADNCEEIRHFMSLWQYECPIVCIPTSYPGVTTQILTELGVSLVIYANLVSRSIVATVRAVLAEVRAAGSLAVVQDKIASVTEIFELEKMQLAGSPHHWSECIQGNAGEPHTIAVLSRNSSCP